MNGMGEMKSRQLVLLCVLIAAVIFLSGCHFDSSGIPDPCWATGICSDPYTAAHGWNNCPPDWQVVYKAGGSSTNGYYGYQSYGASLPSGDPILGPDGQPEIVYPDASNPASLVPIAYCIKPGTNPGWPYIPANGGACLPPSTAYLQGSWSACPDNNQSNDCVCVPPGVTQAVPSATPVPLPTLLFFHDEATKYCVSPSTQLGAVVLSVPDYFELAQISGPGGLTKTQVHANGNNNFYTYVGPAGATFELRQCVIPPGGTPGSPQPNPNLCTAYPETYGTCQAGQAGGGGLCKPPPSGCPSGTFWQGSPTCQCQALK
jgi:hypothetical protein